MITKQKINNRKKYNVKIPVYDDNLDGYKMKTIGTYDTMHEAFDFWLERYIYEKSRQLEIVFSKLSNNNNISNEVLNNLIERTTDYIYNEKILIDSVLNYCSRKNYI